MTSARIWSAICRYRRRGSMLWNGMEDGRDGAGARGTRGA
jgi:hypothetical protein